MKSVEMNDFERHMFQFLATICSQNREKGKVIEQGDSFGTNGRKQHEFKYKKEPEK